MGAGLLLVAGRTLVFDLVSLSGDSMLPSFAAGQVLVVSRLAEPQAGDVVVVRIGGTGERYVKRVAAGPGALVEVTGGHVRIGGLSTRAEDPDVDAPWHCRVDGLPLHTEQQGARRVLVVSDERSAEAVELGADEWFLLSDNRGAGFDSRHWGALSTGEIDGVVVAALPGSDRCEQGPVPVGASHTVE